MIELLSAIALASAAGAADSEPPTVFAKDSERAVRMEIDDPETIICVRSLMTNSRTRYQKTCLTQDQWKSVQLEKDAQAQDMRMSAKGAVIK